MKRKRWAKLKRYVFSGPVVHDVYGSCVRIAVIRIKTARGGRRGYVY